jgi:hypothetical protein
VLALVCLSLSATSQDLEQKTNNLSFKEHNASSSMPIPVCKFASNIQEVFGPEIIEQTYIKLYSHVTQYT